MNGHQQTAVAEFVLSELLYDQAGPDGVIVTDQDSQQIIQQDIANCNSSPTSCRQQFGISPGETIEQYFKNSAPTVKRILVTAKERRKVDGGAATYVAKTAAEASWMRQQLPHHQVQFLNMVPFDLPGALTQLGAPHPSFAMPTFG